MFFNKLFYSSQCFFRNIYKKSNLLKSIDYFIFIAIILVIFLSAFVSSDSIVVPALGVIILTFIKLMTRPRSYINISKLDFLLILYLLIVLISVAGSTLLTYSLKGFFKTLIYFGFYFSAVNYFSENKSKIKYILLSIALIVFGESIVALKQNFLSVAEISGWQDVSRLNPEQVMTRVYGTLKPYNPNLFGGYLIATFPSTILLTVLPLINKHYKTALFGFCCFLLSIITIFLTGCRGAYIALLFELILITLFTYKYLNSYYKKIFRFISVFFVSILTFIVLSLPSLKARILSIFAMRSDSSNSFRFNVYNSCIDMFKDNWLLGIGVGNQNFREIYGLYMKTGFDALSAYNIYLEMAVESGIFALLVFISFIFMLFKASYDYIKLIKKVDVLYVIIAIISIFGILIHGFVDTVFFRPQIQFIFWIMVAIIRSITIKRSFDFARVRN